MDSGIGRAPESTLAADFGDTYDSAVIAGGDTGELPFSEVGRQARPGGRAPHAWVDLQLRRSSTIDLFDSTLTLLTTLPMDRGAVRPPRYRLICHFRCWASAPNWPIPPER